MFEKYTARKQLIQERLGTSISTTDVFKLLAAQIGQEVVIKTRNGREVIIPQEHGEVSQEEALRRLTP